MISVNQENKIHFLKDRLSKEFLDDIIQALDMHSNGDVHCVLDLVELFNKEKECYSFGNLMLKDPVYQFIRKLDGKQILNSQKAIKLLLDVKPEEDVNQNHNCYSYSFVYLF